MTERIAPSRAGPPTVLVNDISLHSRYDPRREAETFLDSQHIQEGIRFFILIEPALGYLIPAIKRRFPGAGIAALHVSPFLAREQEAVNGGAHVWPPAAADARYREGIGVQDFLEAAIPDLSANEVRIIEWRPAFTALGEGCVSLFREAVEFLKRSDANARTGAFFGRRWVRNFFRNLPLIRRVARPALPSAAPWIIAGAGPSLEESAAAIAFFAGQNAVVLAVSAAEAALFARGVAPALVLSSDGGNWALFHLYGVMRRAMGGGTYAPVFAVSLTAALPSQCAGFPLFPLTDGSVWQRVVLSALNIPHLALPARGTVTALAVDLALTLTGGDVILAGMDLAHRDVQVHARPYALDRFRKHDESRLEPAFSRAVVRSGMLDRAGSLSIYAAWFKKQLALWPPRVFSLGENHPVFAERRLDETAWRGAERGPQSGGFTIRRVTKTPFPARRGFDALSRALMGEEGAAIQGELAPLLFPGEPLPAVEKLIGELRVLARGAAGA
jgi:hypothetical protein